MKHNSFSGSGKYGVVEQVAVVGVTLLCIAACQQSLSQLNQQRQTPTITIQPLVAETEIPALPTMIVQATALPVPSTPVATATTTQTPIEMTDVPVFPAATEPRGLVLVTATPVPPTATTRSPVVKATPSRWPTALPIVPKGLETFTPAPTMTVNPTNPYLHHYLVVKAALDSLVLEPLPPARNATNDGWILTWRARWAPPPLDGVPGAQFLLPNSIPYKFGYDFEMHHVDDPDQYEFAASGDTDGQVQVLDSQLSKGTYLWRIRGGYVSLNIREATDWTPWQIFEIK